MKENLRWKLAQYFEKRWWKNYLRNKSVDEYHQWKKKYWNDLLGKGLDDVDWKMGEGSRALDAGCGPAGIFMVLEKQSVTALDPLLNDYENNLSHFRKSDYPNVEFVNAPLENFRRENVFDVVFCMNAINHVQDYNLSMNNLIDSLKPNGIFVFTIDAHNFSFFKYLFRTVPGDILHPHQYDLKEYKSQLTEREILVLKEVKLKKEFFFNHYLIVGRKEK